MKNNSHLLIEPSVYIRNIPVNMTAEDEHIFQHEFKYTSQEVLLNEYRNANVTTDGMIFKNFRLDTKNIASPPIKWKERIQYYRNVLIPTLLNKRRIVLDPGEKYLLVHDNWSNAYFHWLCDVLPRLSLVESLHKDCILLLPHYAGSGYFKEAIAAWKLKDVFYIPENSYVKAGNLVCPDKIAITGNYNPGIMIRLKEKYGQDVKKAPPSLKLYSSRSRAKAKFITNETEMMSLLKSHGYESVCFEDYTIGENAKLLSGCKSLISMHGANLANMIFMPQGSSVLEFRKRDDKINNAFFSLASSLGISYFYQQCNFQTGHYDHPNRFDLTVDLEKLEAILSAYPTFL